MPHRHFSPARGLPISTSPRARWTVLVPAVVLGLMLASTGLAAAERTLLNVSYDVTREFYTDFNVLFAADWRTKTGDTVVISQSHGGSSKQARAVIDGLRADVVTMNQALDIDAIAERAKLLPTNWAERLPHGSAPTTSVIVFLVRPGNPKRIADWSDLIRPDVRPSIPNPKTSGNGRYSYLAAWAWAARQAGTGKESEQAKARAFVTRLFRQVPVLDTGGRGATTTFIQRGIGDVLLTFESEIGLIRRENGEASIDVVRPSLTILAENPVAVVDRAADRNGNTDLAKAYLEFLYTPAAQELAAKHGLRPRDPDVLARQRERFPAVATVTVSELGGWSSVFKTHFAEGGIFDQLS